VTYRTAGVTEVTGLTSACHFANLVGVARFLGALQHKAVKKFFSSMVAMYLRFVPTVVLHNEAALDPKFKW
jgi:hypothetical protein